jgi:hypothetical protein
MSHNPYAPPKAPLESGPSPHAGEEAPTSRLYSPGQVAFAAFLGGPFAGAWFIAANQRALGRGQRATTALVLGGVATALLIGLAVILPEDVPTLVFTLGVCGAAAAIAHQMFGADLQRHKDAGGELGSWGRVVGFGLLWGVAVAAVAVGVVVGLVAAGFMEL